MKCKFCGKDYRMTNGNHAIYCSPECKAAAIEARTVTKLCAYCGKEFRTHLKLKIYCSDECRTASYEDAHVKAVTCEICGKEFTSTRRSKQNYCPECVEKDKAQRKEEQRKSVSKPEPTVEPLTHKKYAVSLARAVKRAEKAGLSYGKWSASQNPKNRKGEFIYDPFVMTGQRCE